MTEFEQPNHPKSLIILAVGLWLATTALSFIVIPTVIDLATKVYAAFYADFTFYGEAYYGAVALRQLLVLPLGVLALVVIIGGAEYHLQHFNTEKSWRLFTRTLAIQITMVTLAALI